MSIFSDIFGVIKGIVKTIQGGGSIVDLMINTLMKLPQMIGSLKGLFGSDAKTKIDEGLEAFDYMTGSDENALDLIKKLPPDKEEEALDHMKEFMRIVLYCEAKVDGYYVE